MNYVSKLIVDLKNVFILNSANDTYSLLDVNNKIIHVGQGDFHWIDVFDKTNSTYEIYDFNDVIDNKYLKNNIRCEYSNITTVDGKLVRFHSVTIDGKVFKFSEFKFKYNSLFYFFDEFHIKTYLYSKTNN